MSLSARVLVGLALGAAVGLFFGPLVGFLGVAGDAFVRLLQMTVLPYILVSLITGVGKLSYRQAGLLARRGGIILVIFWALALATLCVMPLGLPDWKSATCCSSSARFVARPSASSAFLASLAALVSAA